MFPFPTADMPNILHTKQHKIQYDIFEHAAVGAVKIELQVMR